MSSQGPGISGKLVQTSSASRDSFTSGFSGGFGGFSAAIRSSSITLFRTETTCESVNANKLTVQEWHGNRNHEMK